MCVLPSKIKKLSTTTKNTGICTVNAYIIPVQDKKSTQLVRIYNAYQLLKINERQISQHLPLPFTIRRAHVLADLVISDVIDTILRFCQLTPEFKCPSWRP